MLPSRHSFALSVTRRRVCGPRNRVGSGWQARPLVWFEPVPIQRESKDHSGPSSGRLNSPISLISRMLCRENPVRIEGEVRKSTTNICWNADFNPLFGVMPDARSDESGESDDPSVGRGDERRRAS